VHEEALREEQIKKSGIDVTLISGVNVNMNEDAG